MKKILILFTTLVVIFLACSPSQIVSSWSTNKPIAGIKKILVLGLTGEEERAFCVKMEKHLSDDLATQGFNAFSAFEQYGKAAFENITEKDALEKLSGKGFDAVITIVLLNKEKEKVYIPERMKDPMQDYSQFWDYYATRADRILQKGYYQPAIRYFWETKMYDLNNNKMIYSSKTESFDPVNAETLGHSYGKLIAKNMVDKKVFPSSAAKPF